jgi:hypothetical protein
MSFDTMQLIFQHCHQNHLIINHIDKNISKRESVLMDVIGHEFYLSMMNLSLDTIDVLHDHFTV